MKLYDISRSITPALAVWPGDTPYSAHWVMRQAAGQSVNLSTLTLSAHAGTHVDAPYHYTTAGSRIHELPLEAYVGAATVMELDLRGAVQPQHLAGLDLHRVERLLIKTRYSQLPDQEWDDDFVYLSAAAATLLAQTGLRLFGTDVPSVDPAESQTLDAHRILGRGKVMILENLQLRQVPPGEYELIALPLKLDGDGSPVRAVLRAQV